MMISTKGRYALRFMADVAQHQGEGYVPLKDVASRQQISEKYLEIVVKELVRAGYLSAVRGKGGGYRLSRDPGDYKVKAILELMEGPLVPVACLASETNHCPRKDQCQTLPLWEGLNGVIAKYLDRFTLEDLFEGQSVGECCLL